MDSKILLGLLVAVAVVLAGCHAPEDPVDDGDDTDGGAGNGGDDGDAGPAMLTFEVEDEPLTWSVSDNLTLNVTVSTDQNVTSTHSGFHYGFNSSADTDPANYTQVLDQTSPHEFNETTYPGTYTVEGWQFSEDRAGETVYVRAHVNADGTDHWGEEFSFLLTI